MRPSPSSTPRRGRHAVPRLALTLAVLAATGCAALAQSLAVVPSHVYVQEGDPITFLRAPGSPSLAGITSVGVLGSERLTVAWFDADAERLTVSLRVAGDGAAQATGLVVGRGGVLQDVAVGHATVAPAVPPAGGLLAVPYEHHDPGSGIVGAGLLTNVSDGPLTLRAIELLPTDADAGLPIRLYDGPRPRDAFVTWVDALTASLAGHAAPLPPGTAAEAGLPQRLVALLNGGDAELAWIDPTAVDLVLAPGRSLFWALTPASFASDVRAERVVVAPRFVVQRDAAACCETVPSAGAFSMSWLR